jgi:hypothetical protein
MRPHYITPPADEALPLFRRTDPATSTHCDKSRFEAWKQFHAQNPKVFVLFLSYAQQAFSAGMQRIGARLIGERIRWHSQVETRSCDGFMVNNNFWPYYARLAMLVDQNLANAFERRDAHFDASDEQILSAYQQADQVAQLL